MSIFLQLLFWLIHPIYLIANDSAHYANGYAILKTLALRFRLAKPAQI